MEATELNKVWDTKTGRFLAKNHPIYLDRESIQEAKNRKLQAHLQSLAAKPKLNQGLTKADISRILPAIKILHES